MEGKLNMRLNVTPGERELVRVATALTGSRTMHAFCRAAVLERARKEVEARGLDADIIQQQAQVQEGKDV